MTYVAPCRRAVQGAHCHLCSPNNPYSCWSSSLYVMHDLDRNIVKIGQSVRPVRRRAKLGKQHGTEIVMLAHRVAGCGYTIGAMESLVQEQVAEYRLPNTMDWFAISPEMGVAALDAVVPEAWVRPDGPKPCVAPLGWTP